MNTIANAGAAAFFDIDGTLLPPPSLERQILRYLVWRGELTAGNWLRWGAHFLGRVWRDPLAATHGNKTLYSGVRVKALESFCALFRRHPLPLFPAALARLEWHASQGHSIFFVSGTLRSLADSVAAVVALHLRKARCGVPIPIHVVATELESRDRSLTGQVRGEAICGHAKARALEHLAAEHQLDLGQSYAYGDRYSDRWMLAAVGHPAAVNPCFRLRWFAKRRGWPVLLWGHFLNSNLQPAAQHLQLTA